MGIIYEKKGHIAFVTINRPEARNSLDFETTGQLANAWLDFRDDPNLRVAILTGAGDRDFCVGADLKKFIPAVTENVEELASGKKSLLGDGYAWNTPLIAVLREGDIWKPIIHLEADYRGGKWNMFIGRFGDVTGYRHSHCGRACHFFYCRAKARPFPWRRFDSKVTASDPFRKSYGDSVYL